MTNPNNERVQNYLQGRYKEFAFMSLKPGVGALAVPQLSSALSSTYGVNAIANLDDIPYSESQSGHGFLDNVEEPKLSEGH